MTHSISFAEDKLLFKYNIYRIQNISVAVTQKLLMAVDLLW